MTLQRTGADSERLQDSIAVYTKVIRWGPDGVGFAFVAVDASRREIIGRRLADGTLNMFLKRVLAHENKEL